MTEPISNIIAEVVGPNGPLVEAVTRALRELPLAFVHTLLPRANADLRSVVLIDSGEEVTATCERFADAGASSILIVSSREDPDRMAALVAVGATDFLVWPREAAMLATRLRLSVRRPWFS